MDGFTSERESDNSIKMRADIMNERKKRQKDTKGRETVAKSHRFPQVINPEMRRSNACRFLP